MRIQLVPDQYDEGGIDMILVIKMTTMMMIVAIIMMSIKNFDQDDHLISLVS